MIHRRQFIARNQNALYQCVRQIVGNDKPTNVKTVQAYIFDHLPPFHFQAHAEVGKDLYRRVYVEYDERLTSLQKDLIDFKVAFVREGRLLADTQWQHHRFKTAGHLPEAAAVVLAKHIREYFATATVPDHTPLSQELENLIRNHAVV